MSSQPYLEGDPELDSTRRQMERLLSRPSGNRMKKAAAAGVAAWGLWRLFRLLRPAAWSRPRGTSTKA